MQVAQAFPGARMTDSVTLLTAATASALKASGIDGAFQYLGSITAQGVQDITAAGLGFMPVTYADQFNGPQAVAELQAIGYPTGGDVWLDVESIATTVTSAQLIAWINIWAQAISSAGYVPCIYVGVGCLLTSEELYQLAVVRYWHGASDLRDRNNQITQPQCGWCVIQGNPTVTWKGIPVEVDIDIVFQDWEGRLPMWAVAS
jgi:hypothetical protein